MTKKLMALLLTALLLLSAAPALAADQYGAWTIELTDIVIGADDEEIDTTAALVVQAGFTDNREKGWLTADVMKNGRSLAGFMVEEKESGFSRFAYTAGKTCGVMDGKDGARFHRIAMKQLEIPEKDIPETLSGALDMLDAFLSMPKGVEYLFSQLGSAKKLGDKRYAVRVDLPLCLNDQAGGLKFVRDRQQTAVGFRFIAVFRGGIRKPPDRAGRLQPAVRCAAGIRRDAVRGKQPRFAVIADRFIE